MKKIITVLVTIIVILGLSLAWELVNEDEPLEVTVTNFEQCAAAGNPIMESYPRVCRHNSQTFVEDIGVVTYKDLIRVDSPRPNAVITSPLMIKGEARGNWFFEASFPVTLKDSTGKTIVESFATADGEWMTTEYVPFEAELKFTAGELIGESGTLVLSKDNPSGLPENDDSVEIPVRFK